MRKLIAIIVSLSITAPSWAVLAVDSEMPSNVAAFSADAATSLSFSFNNAAGTLLVCAVVCGGADTGSTINSITFDSASMGTADITRRAGNNTEGLLAIYHLLSPSTGSKTLAIGTSAHGGSIIAGCISFTGNDASTPIINPVAANDNGTGSNPATVNMTSTGSNNILVALAGGGSDFTSNTNTLSALKNINGTYAMNNFSMTRAAGTGGTVTMSSTMSGADFWAIGAVEVAISAGPTAPVMAATTVTDISYTSATGNGNVTSDGGDTVTARGICWATHSSPTTSDTCVTAGSGTGAFTGAITGLASNTRYYVSSYATNSIGTSYGADGGVYALVRGRLYKMKTASGPQRGPR